MRKTTAADRARLDLSCVLVAGSSAEPIRERTVADFCAAFGTVSGLRPEALTPIYGSAEHFGAGRGASILHSSHSTYSLHLTRLNGG